MATIINRTVNIHGLDVALSNTHELKKASALLIKELGRVEIGSKKYNELNNEIAKIKATQSQLRKEQRSLTDELLAVPKPAIGAYEQLRIQLKRAQEEYRNLAASGKENTAEGKKSLATLVSLDARLKQINATQRNLTRETLPGGKQQIGSYRKLSAQLIKTRSQYKDLAAEGKGNTKAAKSLLVTVNRLDTELKKIDATVGQNQRSVGKYSNALNGAGKAMFQLVGAAGALTLGISLFRQGAQAVLEFDRQLIAVGKTTDLAGLDLKQLGDDIRNLGAERTPT